ncbi:DinB family protein [Cryptosporangium phraense]|uniref:DinB family protein n=2 Tax=Cryptosporangium phraense TaxID=2593070 RepID=A0A545AQE9_9ACTN|nr:DinB family protein [Cryptosporangium phraense]
MNRMTDRRAPFIVGDERTTLLTFLTYLRQSIIHKVEDLTEEEARRPVVPSGWSLAGLLKHLTVSERYWFRHVWAGEPGIGWDRHSWDVAAGVSVDQLIDDYRESWKESDRLVETAPNFDVPCAEEHRNHRMSLRWVIVHMIEETARHAGHADVTRELIDGSTGR